MSALFDQIQLLHKQKLHSNVTKVTEMILKVSENTTGILSASHKFQIYGYQGDSHYFLGNYRQAEIAYKSALTLKDACSVENVPSHISFQSIDRPIGPMPDVDIKYQLYLCLVKLKDSRQALSVLQSIPSKERKTKINMALAKLHHEMGNISQAVTAYNEVLKDCPLAIEAAEGLLSLGVKEAEVNAIMSEIAGINGLEWISGWIKAHTYLFNYDKTPLAINTLKQLDSHTPLCNSSRLIVALGKSYYYSGECKNALIYLQRAYRANPHMQDGLSTLAMCLYTEKCNRDLEKLLPASYTDESLIDSHIWIVFAIICYSNSNYPKALCIIQKACSADPNNIEALLLHGMILKNMENYTKAILQFYNVIDIVPYFFDPYEGIVDCYLGLNKMAHAVSVAKNCCKQMKDHPKALTLYASIIFKDPVTVGQAKLLLERALTTDEHYLPAIYILARIYEEEGKFSLAFDLLHKETLVQPNVILHQKLSDLSSRRNLLSETLDDSDSAFRLNPDGNEEAMESLNNLKKPCNTLTATSTASAEPVLNGSLTKVTFSDENNEKNESSTPLNTAHEEDTFIDSNAEGPGSDYTSI